MSEQNIKLIKQLLTNQDASGIIDRAFSELISKKNRITHNEFFDYYNNLFYDIPKLGPLSHTELVNRSMEYLNNYQDERDLEIAELNATILALSQQIDQLEQDQFSNEYQTLEKTVIIQLKLEKGDWPKNNWNSRVKNQSLNTHQIIIDDYVNDKKYIRNSYNNNKSTQIEFTTNSSMFSYHYDGRNIVEKAAVTQVLEGTVNIYADDIHDDGVVWRTGWADPIAIPDDMNPFVYPVTIIGERSYNMEYLDWQSEAAPSGYA
jgi:hypothetical protein